MYQQSNINYKMITVGHFQRRQVRLISLSAVNNGHNAISVYYKHGGFIGLDHASTTEISI